MTSPQPALVLDRLTVRYPGHTVCADLSLTVERGAVYALLGRNGSGKTSIVRTVLGLQPAALGRVVLLGADPRRERSSVLAQVGYVPEHPEVPPAWSARDAARFVAPLYPAFDHGGLRQQLERRGIDAGRPVRSLSRGERTHVSLALALAQRPALLVLDDPTLGLDAGARLELWRDLVDELAMRETTVLVTSHDLAGIETLATHVGVLHGGRLLANEGLETLKGRFRRLRLAPDPAQPVLLREHRHLGDGWITDRYQPHAPAFATTPAAALETLSLEEIFLALTDPAAAPAQHTTQRP